MRRRIDDDDNIVRDGESVSVRVNLTDTVRFDEDGRERFVRMADARRKKPPDDDDDDDDDTTDANMIDAAAYRPGFRYAADATRAAARAAYDGMVRRAENAWKMPRPIRDAAEPDLGTRPDELAMRRHMFGASGLPDPSTSHAMEFQGEQAQRARDRAWSSYKDQLTNAWRGGRTDPRRAAQVEGLQERWRHGRDGATEG
jgi:hypothetical protein